MKIDIDVRALKAVALFASTDKTRYYLNGVYVEAGNGIVTLVACDGARLAAIRLAAIRLECECPAERVAFIMPSSLIANIKLRKTSEKTVSISYTDEIRVEWEGQTFIAKECDGTFPDWRRVFPSDITDVTAQFDHEQLVDFRNASRILGDSAHISITHNGDHAALVNFSTNYEVVGLIMPIKAHAGMLSNTPYWVHHAPATSSAEKIAEPA